MDTPQYLTPVVAATALQDTHSFVTGYLRARGQSALAQVTTWPWGITVRYGPGMDRQVEHFVWDAGAGLEPVVPSHGDWLTLFGGSPPPAMSGLALQPRASECFMATDLRALCRQLDGAEGRFTAPPACDLPTPDVARFHHEVQGHTVAGVCCANALGGDALLDRLATAPAHRGRGMARSLMRAAAAWALEQGRERLLLIASPDGRALYARLGFHALSSVRVFTLEGPSHAR